jgi:hypothetical protein
LLQARMLAIKFLMHIFQALAYPVAYLFCKYAMNFGYGIYLERYATIRNTGNWVFNCLGIGIGYRVGRGVTGMKI